MSVHIKEENVSLNTDWQIVTHDESREDTELIP